VPLQWMLGLRRLKLDAIWLEHLPSEGNSRDDERKIDNFQRQLRAHGLGGRYCLLYHKTPDSAHDLDALRCIGISKRELLDRLAGPNALLNLSYSIHPPLLFEIRAPDLLRSRSERNHLLDDADGDGPVVSPRVLDHWAKREQR